MDAFYFPLNQPKKKKEGRRLYCGYGVKRLPNQDSKGSFLPPKFFVIHICPNFVK